jgi:pyruvate kinase
MSLNEKSKTKIVCTMGPSSRDPEMLRRMALAGMDVVRINTGHLDVEELLKYIDVVVGVSEKMGRRIGIMLDLQGPRLRVGSIQGSSVELSTGRDFIITTEQKRGDDTRVSVSYAALPSILRPGDPVLIDDGLIRLKVKSIDGNDVLCEVVEGGPLLQGKGMNFPGVALGLPSFTDRDRKFLEAGLKHGGIDWVALSFVSDGGDVTSLRKVIEQMGYRVSIMAKIEKREAVHNIDSIMKAADGVMIARGDLGVEMPTEDVPLIQKKLIRKALHAAKPVVTATQMLESMITNPRPTRAEASDVANSILDGTDAVMLSAETAIGSYPVQTVETMAKISNRTEQALDYGMLLRESARWSHPSAADAIGFAACEIASNMKAKAIVTITRSGYTARLIARYRPHQPIIAVSSDPETIDKILLVWSVRTLVANVSDDLKATIESVVGECKKAGYVKSGDLLVMTGGFLADQVGTTNLIKVKTVE